MTTAAEIITDALTEILVQPSEAPIQASEAQAAIRWLNRWMSQLKSNGVDLGYTKITNLADTVTVVEGAEMGMVANLAVALAPQYSAPVSPALIQAANDGLQTMRKLGDVIQPMSLYDQCPIGSGNEGDGSWVTTHFFNDEEEETLAEITIPDAASTVVESDADIVGEATGSASSDAEIPLGDESYALVYINLDIESVATGQNNISQVIVSRSHAGVAIAEVVDYTEEHSVTDSSAFTVVDNKLVIPATGDIEIDYRILLAA